MIRLEQIRKCIDTLFTNKDEIRKIIGDDEFELIIFLLESNESQLFDNEYRKMLQKGMDKEEIQKILLYRD